MNDGFYGNLHSVKNVFSLQNVTFITKSKLRLEEGTKSNSKVSESKAYGVGLTYLVVGLLFEF
jgi:hypothetical protein